MTEHTSIVVDPMLALLGIPKKTKREIQDGIRKEKALAKAAKKASFRRKTEKKLAEKAERKVMHKVNNTKRKLDKKLEARNSPGKIQK